MPSNYVRASGNGDIFDYCRIVSQDKQEGTQGHAWDGGGTSGGKGGGSDPLDDLDNVPAIGYFKGYDSGDEAQISVVLILSCAVQFVPSKISRTLDVGGTAATGTVEYTFYINEDSKFRTTEPTGSLPTNVIRGTGDNNVRTLGCNILTGNNDKVTGSGQKSYTYLMSETVQQTDGRAFYYSYDSDDNEYHLLYVNCNNKDLTILPRYYGDFVHQGITYNLYINLDYTTSNEEHVSWAGSAPIGTHAFSTGTSWSDKWERPTGSDSLFSYCTVEKTDVTDNDEPLYDDYEIKTGTEELKWSAIESMLEYGTNQKAFLYHVNYKTGAYKYANIKCNHKLLLHDIYSEVDLEYPKDSGNYIHFTVFGNWNYAAREPSGNTPDYQRGTGSMVITDFCETRGHLEQSGGHVEWSSVKDPLKGYNSRAVLFWWDHRNNGGSPSGVASAGSKGYELWCPDDLVRQYVKDWIIIDGITYTVWLHTTRVSYQAADLFGDPHLHGAHGGLADFRGKDNQVYSMVSAPNISFAMRVKDTDFLLPRQLVHGSFFTNAYFTVRTQDGSLLHVSIDAAKPGFVLHMDDKVVEIGAHRTLEYNGALIESKEVATKVTAAGWTIGVKRSAIKAPLKEIKWRLDVDIATEDGKEEFVVAPHGILGQTFDGDNTGVNGALDKYHSAGTEFTTTAQAEGFIEGVADDYILSQPFDTKFKFSRFDTVTPTAARNVAALSGEKFAASKTPKAAGSSEEDDAQ
jgi:hypothetical protein